MHQADLRPFLFDLTRDGMEGERHENAYSEKYDQLHQGFNSANHNHCILADCGRCGVDQDHRNFYTAQNMGKDD